MKTLMTSISKLKEVFEEVALSANLAPYPVEPVGGMPSNKKKRKWVVEGDGPYIVTADDGTRVKTSFKSKKYAQEICDKYNGSNED